MKLCFYRNTFGLIIINIYKIISGDRLKVIIFNFEPLPHKWIQYQIYDVT